MNDEISIKVTTINGRHHARIYREDGTVHSEMACAEKQDVGYICRELARWYDKRGGESEQCSASRDRSAKKKQPQPVGRIWWESDLEKEKENRNGQIN